MWFMGGFFIGSMIGISVMALMASAGHADIEQGYQLQVNLMQRQIEILKGEKEA
jgi:hypothetical protein